MDSETLKYTMNLNKDEACPSNQFPITYLQYMRAIQAFIEENLIKLYDLVLLKSPNDAAIKSIDLVAEKRGADYFPASVRVRTTHDNIWFAANVALTERGLSRIERDYELLKYLGSKNDLNFLPQVFFINEPENSSASLTGSPNRIFLAEWFRDYHEFHITGNVKGDTSILSFWNTDKGYFELSESVAFKIIEQISYILASYYDLETYQEIYPWHHAAGDFIAKLDHGPDVKLISVRQYEPRVFFSGASYENPNQALLFFLVNLMIRSRIDRIDGTGRFAWLKGRFDKPVFYGFFKSIMREKRLKHGGYDFLKKFIKTLDMLTLEDWTCLFVQAVESYDQRAPDLGIIKDNLVEHILNVYQTCRELLTNNKIYEIK
ncbi:MAG: hypothetical protein ACP5VS_09415 [Desulfomonilaceae bacterium]